MLEKNMFPGEHVLGLKKGSIKAKSGQKTEDKFCFL